MSMSIDEFKCSEICTPSSEEIIANLRATVDDQSTRLSRQANDLGVLIDENISLQDRITGLERANEVLNERVDESDALLAQSIPIVETLVHTVTRLRLEKKVLEASLELAGFELATK